MDDSKNARRGEGAADHSAAQRTATAEGPTFPLPPEGPFHLLSDVVKDFGDSLRIDKATGSVFRVPVYGPMTEAAAASEAAEGQARMDALLDGGGGGDNANGGAVETADVCAGVTERNFLEAVRDRVLEGHAATRHEEQARIFAQLVARLASRFEAMRLNGDRWGGFSWAAEIDRVFAWRARVDGQVERNVRAGTLPEFAAVALGDGAELDGAAIARECIERDEQEIARRNAGEQTPSLEGRAPLRPKVGYYDDDLDDECIPSALRAEIDALNEASERTIEKERQERIAAANLKIGTPEEYAHLVVSHAQMLSFLTEDPCRRDAFEAIKTAVLGMLGEREKLPLDSLTRLRERLLGHEVKDSKVADIRTIAALVEGRERFVRDFQGKGVREESGPLCESVQRAIGGPFLRLTPAHCGSALEGLLRTHGSGKRSVNGVVADLILAVGAYGHSEDDRAELQTIIGRATAEGRGPKRMATRKPKEKKAAKRPRGSSRSTTLRAATK